MDPRHSDEHSERRPDNRSYMPTPEQYVASLPTADLDGLSRRSAPHARRARRRRIWPTLVLAVLLVSLVSVLVYAGYIAYNISKISTKPFQLGGLAADETGRVNVLVLGLGDPGHEGEGLTDTMMVISIDSRTKRVAQISIPRDLRVKIPGYGTGKINEANADGGVELAEQVVADTLDIPINYYVKTNFTGVRQLVDAVGGIDVDVKDRLVDPEYPCDDNQYKVCGLDIEPGVQHMDGTTALQYSRCRKGTCGDDFGRAARQQEVLNLVRDKVVRPDLLLNPRELTQVVTAVRSGVETDMGSVQAVEFGRLWEAAKTNQPVSLVLSTADGGYLKDSGSSDLAPIGGSFDAIQARVKDIFSESQN
jgi:polyisoprenyl-teichoic acid--peptidoglycan teichoic acid transferase